MTVSLSSTPFSYRSPRFGSTDESYLNWGEMPWREAPNEDRMEYAVDKADEAIRATPNKELEELAESGNIRAQRFLAHKAQMGFAFNWEWGVPNYDKAEEWWKRAAQSGDVESLFNYASFLLEKPPYMNLKPLPIHFFEMFTGKQVATKDDITAYGLFTLASDPANPPSEERYMATLKRKEMDKWMSRRAKAKATRWAQEFKAGFPARPVRPAIETDD